MKYYLLILPFLLLLTTEIQAQRKTRIELLHSDGMSVDKKLGRNIKRLKGNVKFKHGQTLMYCDSAYLDSRKNKLTAFSNVHINDNDSVHIYGDILEYEGNMREAVIRENVRLRDQNMLLTTNLMTYDMSNKVGNYYSGGTIVDEQNKLTSVFGTYYSESKIFFFKKDVVLVNPDYRMEADTLKYNTRSEISYFVGPTRITSEDNLIYCENGWYNTRTDVSQYNENAYLQTKEQKLEGDSLYYDRNRSYGEAFNNVTITDTVKNVILYGHHVEYYEKGGSSYIADSTLAIFINETQDSLFLHADTLRLLFDSLQEAEYLLSYYNTRFYREDFQGKCDSLVYNFKDSLMEMFYSPVVWAEESQLSGEFVWLTMEHEQIKNIFVEKQGFLISNDTLENFNQVKGKRMIGYFVEDELRKVDVKGNAETLYFVRDEDDQMIGVNISTSSDVRANITNDGIKTIAYYDKPDATLYPEEDLSPKDKLLKDFKWLEKIRPLNRHDVFRTGE